MSFEKKVCNYLIFVGLMIFINCVDNQFPLDASKITPNYNYALNALIQAGEPIKITLANVLKDRVETSQNWFIDSALVMVNGDTLIPVDYYYFKCNYIEKGNNISRPGSEIEIQACFSGTTIIGNTRIPDDFEIEGIVHDTLIWGQSKGAYGYNILIYIKYNEGSEADWEVMYNEVVFDNSFPLISKILRLKNYLSDEQNNNYIFDSTMVEIKAFDRNYFYGVLDEYATQMGVQNGYGIVASEIVKKKVLPIY